MVIFAVLDTKSGAERALLNAIRKKTESRVEKNQNICLANETKVTHFLNVRHEQRQMPVGKCTK